ncbi:SDR family oxidoreductase [Erwinia sp. 9145]|uniref:SDR family oxidoreductase n=1 Tax=Erwinia sp. 9145 TaxID=1500895 RepID=UPI000557E83E|nr:SDR family oxidoreductase [Erwinia sp. 9145]
MRVFLTGATGFIGSHILPELLAAGHQVIGMTRSDAGAQSLKAAGAEAFFGTLEDPESLRDAASRADAVIHTAFDHNFARFVENCEKDGRVIEALGEALKNSDRPLIITSAVGIGDAGQGQPATEDIFNANHPNPRIISEATGNRLLEAGVNVQAVRLPQVHNTVKQGLISPFVEMTREKGRSAWVGEGTNCWSAAHVLDVAKLYALVLEKGQKGARYHAVDEEGVPARDIAEVVGAGLGVPAVSLSPEEAQQHFGWLARFMVMDLRASSTWTRQQLGWQPTGPRLLDDLRAMDYHSS